MAKLGEILMLRDVLKHINEIGWPLGLVRRRGKGWEPDAEVILYDRRDDVPEELLARGFEDVDLGMADIQAVVDNLRQQKADVSVQEMLAAIAYYEEYDAFIEL